MSALRVLIVDDERLARQRLRRLLEEEAGVEIAGEADSAAEAVAAIREQAPDLVFLDVQMQDLDGFDVIKTVGPDTMPAVIFVTAYDTYALRAFEVHALDYLLKPFDRGRFREALERARRHIRAGSLDRQLWALLQTVEFGRKASDRIVIRGNGRVFFLRTDEIDWVEAEDNYVRLHVGRESHLLRETLNTLEKRLDASKFLRIHRSTIINLDRVRELQPLFHGNYAAVLEDGTKLTLSRSYRDRLNHLIGDSL